MKALRSIFIRNICLSFLSLVFVIGTVNCENYSSGPDPKYTSVIAEMERMIEHEMETKEIPSFSISIVDDEKMVWAKSFGKSDYKNDVPATNNTIYKIGSVSKLFTDIAIMQMVEQGKIDIDAPVTTYLPDFNPNNPYEKEITLRQLMTHRSGLVREPPIGNYYDDTEPSLAATIESLNSTDLVFEPETQVKYSNAAIGVVGYVLEKINNKPFAQYLSETLLAQLDMKSSGFEPSPLINSNLAKAKMWRFDGAEFEAPEFQLGFAPAGSMYSTMSDLAKFMVALIQGGGKILTPESLEEMLTPQFTDSNTGYGLGFRVGNLNGHKVVSHGGAIYGFSTDLKVLPDAKIGVAASASEDVVNSVVRRITSRALELMVGLKDNQAQFEEAELSTEISLEDAKEVEGVYADGSTIIELNIRKNKLVMETDANVFRLASLNGSFIVDDRLAFGEKVIIDGDDMTYRGMELKKMPFPGRKPSGVSAKMKEYIGEYGWDHDILYIYERNGSLTLLLEWMEVDRMEEVSKDVYKFPDASLFIGEHLTFKRDNTGKITDAVVGVVPFKRRDVGTADGETFVIKPEKPYDELYATARATEKPVEEGDFLEPDLVEVITLDKTIKLDIRYATTNNFMQAVFYTEPRAFLQREAAEGLVRVHKNLKKYGYGVLIHDAYRPWYVTKMFWDATPEEFKIFVATPSIGSVHNRGAAVDMTLYNLRTGKPVQMVGGYDEFSDRSFPFYVGGTTEQRWLRSLLRKEMEREGFEVYEWEWWHFNHKNARNYKIGNKVFDQIGR